MQLILILALAGVLLFGAALGALCYAEVNPPPVSAERPSFRNCCMPFCSERMPFCRV